MADMIVQKTETVQVYKGIGEIEEAIRNGKILPGYQIILTMDGEETLWDVIGKDCEELVNQKLTRSITIQLHGLLKERHFDTKTEWGANKWETSEIRAYLNSDEFKNRFADIVPYLAKVRKENSSGKQTEDLFFLLTEAEYTPGKTPYQYYEDKRNRVKFNDIGDSEWHWTRSAYPNAVSLVRVVCASGIISSCHARYDESQFSPACVIGVDEQEMTVGCMKYADTDCPGEVD